jgi:hypothetical protein
MQRCTCGDCHRCVQGYYRRRRYQAALRLIDAHKYGELYAEMRRIGEVRSTLNPETWSHVPVPIDGKRVLFVELQTRGD